MTKIFIYLFEKNYWPQEWMVLMYLYKKNFPMTYQGSKF